MTLRHIKIFLSVCENGFNTTRTAGALHMTQPAVSLAIRELEGHYGVALFDRIGRRLRITPAGERFFEYASHISTLFDDLEKRLRNSDSFGELRVGASMTIGSQFLPVYINEFNKQYPGIDVRAFVAPSGLLEQRLLDNSLDLALAEDIASSTPIMSQQYMQDHLVVVCPAGGEFEPGGTISIELFKRQKFLLRERGSGTREVFERAIAGAGFSVSPIWEAMSTTALVNAVINGLGIAVLPYRLVAGPLERGLITTVNVEGLEFRRWFNILWHRNKFLTPAAQAFIELCRSFESERPLPPHVGLI